MGESKPEPDPRASSVDTPAPGPSRRSRAPAQRLRQIVGKVAGAIVGCGLIIWSVFNLSVNAMEFWATVSAGTADRGNWAVTVPLVLVFCLLPLGAGFALLFRSLQSLALTDPPPKS